MKYSYARKTTPVGNAAKELLFASAHKLLSWAGNFEIEDVARDANRPKSTVYYYFVDKEEFIRAAYQWWREKVGPLGQDFLFQLSIWQWAHRVGIINDTVLEDREAERAAIAMSGLVGDSEAAARLYQIAHDGLGALRMQGDHAAIQLGDEPLALLRKMIGDLKNSLDSTGH